MHQIRWAYWVVKQNAVRIRQMSTGLEFLALVPYYNMLEKQFYSSPGYSASESQTDRDRERNTGDTESSNGGANSTLSESSIDIKGEGGTKSFNNNKRAIFLGEGRSITQRNDDIAALKDSSILATLADSSSASTGSGSSGNEN